jgi:hypothetical protein
MNAPREVQFPPMAQLPEQVRCSSLISAPLGGKGAYSAGEQIQFPLVKYGFLVPTAGYITAKVKISGTIATNAGELLSIPAQSWISRSDIFINSVGVDTIQNYGAVSSMLLHSKMNYCSKMGFIRPIWFKSFQWKL